MIRFDIYRDGQKWCARAPDADIFTHGNSLEGLLENIRGAVLLYTGGTPAETLHYEQLGGKGS